MNGLQIKINDIWVNLAEDFALDFHQTSFLFNEQDAFSYPFEIPLAANRMLTKNITDPFGKIHLANLDYTDAEIWFDGILLYKGFVRTDEEVEFEDALPFTFFSKGGDFNKRIEELSMQDVPLDRDIKLGYAVTRAWTMHTEFKKIYSWSLGLPQHLFMNFTESNVSDPYPVKPFCTVRVCTADELGHYKILDAHRPNSGVCFYLMYFIDCLFKYLEIPLDKSDLYDEKGKERFEDLNRLAFFNTRCECMAKGDTFKVPLSNLRKDDFLGEDFTLTQKIEILPQISELMRPAAVTIPTEKYEFTGQDLYATNKNFPNEKVKSLFEDLSTAFGMRFHYDAHAGVMKVVLLRDVFRSSEIRQLDVPVVSCVLTQNRSQRVRLSYGVDDDTAFNYSDYSNLEVCANYAEVLSHGVSLYDRRCFLDSKTGNAYRVKVNKNTGGDPSLFEVGGFNDFVTAGEGSDEEEMKINFSPVVLNDVTRHIANAEGKYTEGGQVLAPFADVQLKKGDTFSGSLPIPSLFDRLWGSAIPEFPVVNARCQELYDMEQEEKSPLASYDAGYTLGIMRGPGNDAKVEYTQPNYDGEGNSSFVFVESTYAFTADSCNNHGLFYDYNGTMTGGADQEGRFSLKLTAKKMNGDQPLPIDKNYENRGLVSTFLAEYMYFLSHKKKVTLLVNMSIPQILNIDYSKRYKIGDYTGFINQISYTLAVDGLHNVEVELYVL